MYFVFIQFYPICIYYIYRDVAHLNFLVCNEKRGGGGMSVCINAAETCIYTHVVVVLRLRDVVSSELMRSVY